MSWSVPTILRGEVSEFPVDFQKCREGPKMPLMLLKSEIPTQVYPLPVYMLGTNAKMLSFVLCAVLEASGQFLEKKNCIE